MRTRQISQDSFEILDAIDRRGSFAKAAEELDKATSAISYGVTKLEAQLGITIFERKGRRSVLTPAGQLLLKEGRVILAATARLADRARELANGWEARLRIGLEATMNQPMLFEILAQFQREHPDMELDVSETLLNGSWEALEAKRVDLLVGAVGPVPAHKGFRAVSLGETDLVPVISRLHPQAAEIALSNDHSAVQKVINHDTATSDVARSEGLALTGRNAFFVQTMEQKTQAIKAGLGIGHVPRGRIKRELESGELIPLAVAPSNSEQFIAWALNNRGKGLQHLVQALQSAA